MENKVDIEKEIMKHKSKVKKQLQKAKQGEMINLTDLMIGKEKIQKKIEGIE